MTTTRYLDDFAGRLCEKYDTILLRLASEEAIGVANVVAVLDAEPKDGGTFGRRRIVELLNEGEGVRDASDLIDLVVDLVVTSRASRVPMRILIADTCAELGRVNENAHLESLPHALLSLAGTSAITSLAVDEDLLAENASVYIDTRIVRDLRPAYEEDALGDPIAIVKLISQQRLRIRYWSEGLERVFEVTMRDEDLDDLERWIFRAKRKANLLPTWPDNLSGHS